MKIAISGGPKTGKTTLSERLREENDFIVLFHGDDLIGSHDWSEASEKISEYFDLDHDLIVEGVQVPRALRKWLARNPHGNRPCHTIYHLSFPHISLSAGQLTMMKGVEKVWREILPELVMRGVDIRTEAT